MTLIEALSQALHSLNSGGVPVVLVRDKTPRSPLTEIQLRWTPNPKSPFEAGGSMRGPMIIERRFWVDTLGKFTAWQRQEGERVPLFSIADVYNDCFHEAQAWDVRYPQHKGQSGFPCKACALEEDRQPVTVKHTRSWCARVADIKTKKGA